MAAKKNLTTLNSNFHAVRKAGHEFVDRAVEKALEVGEDTAKDRLQRQESSRGYSLNTLYAAIDKQKQGAMSGRVYVKGSGGTRSLDPTIKAGGDTADTFYARFFEYGTLHIKAMPFMRPAHRKMRKQFLDDMGDNFEGWIRKRAGVKRR